MIRLAAPEAANYQTLINNALRSFVEGQRVPSLEQSLRRIIREELRKVS